MVVVDVRDERRRQVPQALRLERDAPAQMQDARPKHGVRQQPDPVQLDQDSRVPDVDAAGPGRLSGARHVSVVGRQSGDHEHVQRDDQDRPDGLIGDEEEVPDRAERRERDADDPRPGRALEDPVAGADHDHAADQVDPAPGGRVELVRVVRADDEELVVDDRRESGEGMEDADQHQHHAGEHDESDRPAADFPRCHRSSVPRLPPGRSSQRSPLGYFTPLV